MRSGKLLSAQGHAHTLTHAILAVLQEIKIRKETEANILDCIHLVANKLLINYNKLL